MSFFDNIGFTAHGVLNLTPSESFELCRKGAVIVDVREEYITAFKIFRMAGVIFLPFSRLENAWDLLPSDIPLIVADSVSIKSREAVVFLKQKGFKDVANMAGGFVDWERDGLPVTTDESYKLSGSCLCQLKPKRKFK
jgi:rhodanese-related sulfurtransferase